MCKRRSDAGERKEERTTESPYGQCQLIWGGGGGGKVLSGKM
jgi:hypothetical protein